MAEMNVTPCMKKALSQTVICGAKTRNGTACRNNPITGKKRCRMHGGTSPSGKDHWNFKHGYSTKEERQKHSEWMHQLRECRQKIAMFRKEFRQINRE
jgi:hypothetical protein